MFSSNIIDMVRELPAESVPAETQIYEADGLWVKQIVIPKARTILGQHAHQLSHLTLVACGAVRVRRGHLSTSTLADGQTIFAPDAIHIPAGELHSFETLVDGTVLYCIHALASPDALKVLAEHGLVE